MQNAGNGRRQNHLLSGRYRSICFDPVHHANNHGSMGKSRLCRVTLKIPVSCCAQQGEKDVRRERGGTTRGPAGEKEHGRVPEGARGARPLRGGAKSWMDFPGGKKIHSGRRPRTSRNKKNDEEASGCSQADPRLTQDAIRSFDARAVSALRLPLSSNVKTTEFMK